MLTLGLDWSTDSLFSDARVTGSAAVMYMGGDHISGDYVGDLQGLNNIEADTGWRLYEVWTEFAFGGNTNTTLRAGVLDLNAEFDAPETLGLFVAPPHGIGTDLSQTGSAGPSIWPITGLGIRAAGAWENGLTWRFGVYDGAPGSADGTAFSDFHVSSDEGALMIGELAYSSDRFNKVSFGVWNYSAKFDRIDADLMANPQPESGNQGFYALIDMSLGEIGDTALDGALRVGNAKAQFNPVDHYVGAALTASNFWAGRPDDAFGFGVAYAHMGNEYRATQAFAVQRPLLPKFHMNSYTARIHELACHQARRAIRAAPRRRRVDRKRLDRRLAIRNRTRTLLAAQRAPRKRSRRQLRPLHPLISLRALS